MMDTTSPPASPVGSFISKSSPDGAGGGSGIGGSGGGGAAVHDTTTATAAQKSMTPVEGLRVEVLLEKVRVQAELLRAKDKQIELLRAQLLLVSAASESTPVTSSVPVPSSPSSPTTTTNAPTVQLRQSSEVPSEPRSNTTSPPEQRTTVDGSSLEGAVLGLQELLARYEQLEKRVTEVSAPTKAHPLRKQPSAILRNRLQHKRIGSDVPSDLEEERAEENESPAPLPSLQVLLQQRAPLTDIRRKLEEEPSCLFEKDMAGQTPLHLACSIPNVNVEVVKTLIAGGSNVKDTDANGWTALHFACMENAHKDLIWLLISSGADPAAPNADGTRPFHYLVCRKAIEYDRDTVDQIRGSILCLLKGGADINQPNRNGDTPLHLAALHDGYDIVQILLESGADLTITNALGESVLHYAIMGMKKIVVEKLLEKGLDPRIPTTPTVPSPLQLAAKLGHKGKDIYNILRAKVSLLDMKDMSEDEKRIYRRNLSIEELILTEKEYIHDLKVLVRVFLEPIKRALSDEDHKTKILDEQEMRLIFGNVEEILQVSESLHDALDHEWNEALNAARPPNVGQIFLDNLPALREYEKLCMHQQMATESLDKALSATPERDDGNATNSRRFRRKEEERSEFAIFCEEAKRNKDCRRLDIASFLIKPFQRVTKYPLLFREIMSYMNPSDPDFSNLKEAQEEIGKMIAKANEKKRIVDTFQQLMEIQSRLILPAGTNLIKKGRAFVQEGRFQVSVNREKLLKRILFLFTDLLIVAQLGKKERDIERSVCLHIVPLAELNLADISDGSTEAAKIAKSAFSLQHKREPLRIVAFAANEEEKKDWMHMISTRIAAASESASESTTEGTQTFINLQSGSKGTVIDPPRASVRMPNAEDIQPKVPAWIHDVGSAKLSSSMIVRPSDRKDQRSESPVNVQQLAPSWTPATRRGIGPTPGERKRGIGGSTFGARPSPQPSSDPLLSPRNEA